jgi:hypothetical protein
MAFTEDLAPFFTDLAISCTIGGAVVDAIFSNRAEETLYAAGTSPTLTVKSEDVSETARGDAVTVSGAAYTVARIEHDGTGMARVTLEKV